MKGLSDGSLWVDSIDGDGVMRGYTPESKGIWDALDHGDVQIRGGTGEVAGRQNTIKVWKKPHVDPPKDYAVSDLLKESPFDPDDPAIEIDARRALSLVADRCEGTIGN